MSTPGEERAGGNHSAGRTAVTISTELMVAAVIFLFMVVVFVFFLYLYAKHYMASSYSRRRRQGRRGAHFIFPASELPPNHPRRGLDAQVLRALPVTVFRPADFKDGLECAVCLAELSEGEKLRQLPECNHGFHIDCIDMWFQSHSTCPLCRSSVGTNSDSGAEPAAEGAEPLEAEASPVFPTNVLFWGTHDRVNNVRGLAVAGEANTHTPPAHQRSNSSSSLVIQIPTRALEVEGFPSPMTPLPSSRFPAEEMKSPKGGSASASASGASATFKSLKRLLSQGKRAIESSWSPRGGDIEQGLGGGTASGEGSSSPGPKTPTTS